MSVAYRKKCIYERAGILSVHKEFDAAISILNAIDFASTETEYEESTENLYLELRCDFSNTLQRRGLSSKRNSWKYGCKIYSNMSLCHHLDSIALTRHSKREFMYQQVIFMEFKPPYIRRI